MTSPYCKNKEISIMILVKLCKVILKGMDTAGQSTRVWNAVGHSTVPIVLQ